MAMVLKIAELKKNKKDRYDADLELSEGELILTDYLDTLLHDYKTELLAFEDEIEIKYQSIFKDKIDILSDSIKSELEKAFVNYQKSEIPEEQKESFLKIKNLAKLQNFIINYYRLLLQKQDKELQLVII
ncbi:MAG: hypothetical protein H7A25_16695 [Leptospiraceae bacterium]|nr:hypothetical protein [Leptospiraceae bacterium]